MINLLLARHFGFATNSYIIYRGKYLIEESPKKVTTAYNNFYKKELKKVAKPEAITTEMKRIGQQWSTLSATDRSVYESSSAEKTLAAEAKQAYIYKYVTPFKRYNIYSFFVEKFMKNNQLKQEFSRQTKNIVDNYRALAAPDKEKLLKELTSINDARAKIVQGYEIPAPKYPSFRSYRSKIGPKNVALTPEKIEKLKQDYLKEVNAYNNQLKQWLSQRGVTIEEFDKIRLRSLLKEKRRGKKALLNQAKDEKTPVQDGKEPSDKTKTDQSAVQKRLELYSAFYKLKVNKELRPSKRAVKAKTSAKKTLKKIVKKVGKTIKKTDKTVKKAKPTASKEAKPSENKSPKPKQEAQKDGLKA